jgi:hypothetical protein
MKHIQRRLMLIVVCAMALVYVAFLIWLNVTYQIAFNRAFSTYVASRIDRNVKFNSYEFQTRGVKYGMTEQEVDSLMEGATENTDLMRELFRDGHASDQLAKRYTFVYQPEYKFPLKGEETPLIVELFNVVFDRQGKVVRLERYLHMRFDLCFREMRYGDGIANWDLNGDAPTAETTKGR